MANILFSRAGGLLSLEGRSLLFSSDEASIAYAKGKDVEMACRVPVSPSRVLWSEGLSSLHLTPWQEASRTCSASASMEIHHGLARFDPAFLKDTLMFSHCKRLPMEGSAPSDLIMPWKAARACSHCQRESDLCPGGRPSTHLTQHWRSPKGARWPGHLFPMMPRAISWAGVGRVPSPRVRRRGAWDRGILFLGAAPRVLP